MENKISVIVPIYNVEQFLYRCIESIIRQSYGNLEILLIDDGSTDRSSKICDDFSELDSRISVIHKKNGGQSSARNVGLDIATGSFISFVDSDDWIEPDMYESMLKVALKYNADLVTCDPYFVEDGNKRTYSRDNNDIIELTSQSEIFEHVVTANPWVRFEPWNKLFKKDVLIDVRFKEGQIYEEVYFDRIALEKVNVLIAIGRPLYNYQLSRPGNTNSFFTENRYIVFRELDDTIQYVEGRKWEHVKVEYLYAAIETSMLFYISAIDLKAGRKHKKRLKSIFDYYLTIIHESGYHVKMKYIVFKSSPHIYYLISKLLH